MHSSSIDTSSACTRPGTDHDNLTEETLALAAAVSEGSPGLAADREDRYQRVLNSVLDIVFETDNEGNWTFLNPAWTNTTGFSVAESLGVCFLDYVHEDDRAGNIEKFGPLIRREKHYCRHVVRYLTKSGGYCWIEVHAQLKVDGNDQTVGTCGILRDITAQKEAELALKKVEERYALAARGTNDGLWDWDLVSGEIYYSPRWKAMLGYQDGELASTLEAWFDHVHPGDRKHLNEALAEHNSGATEQFECEYRIRHRDQGWRWMLSRGTALRDAEGAATRIAGSLTDVTEARVRDTVTGLSNRTHFVHRLELAIERAAQDPEFHYAVLFLDLDGFKVINDSLGHLAGNEVLSQVAMRLDAIGTTCANGVLVVRLGGDEFGILLEGGLSPGCPMHIAQRVALHLEAPFRVHGREVSVTASIGIALDSKEFRTPEDVLCAADTAMYEAKRAGRNAARVFKREMHERVLRRLDQQNQIRRAIDLKEFEVFYQPQVKLTDGSFSGVEALARWRHPSLGLLAPSRFIELAEETGLIVPLGYLVLETACRQAGKWLRERGDATDWAISVNLSPRQLMDPNLTERVKESLKSHAVPPGRLNLELTESCLVEGRGSPVRVLERLREIGIGLHMDDFGTGYSSLSYLQRFPFTALKLDRSFVSEVATPNSREIVATILRLAQILKLHAVAEGIETAEQAGVLSELECGYGQGYYYSRPLDGVGMDKWMSHHVPPAPVPSLPNFLTIQ